MTPADRHHIVLTTPATAFHEGFPLGNGAFGAMAHGRPHVERFDLNLDTLWSGGPVPVEAGPPPQRLLPQLRRAIRSGDHRLADSLARRMQDKGWTESYQPLGCLEWRYTADTEITDYRRDLDLGRAIAGTAYKAGGGGVRLSAFVSAPAGVLVATVTGSGLLATPVFTSPHLTVCTREHRDGDCRYLVVTGRAPAQVLPNYVDREPAVIYADDDPDQQDGTVATGMGFALVVAVQRTGKDEIRLIAAAASGFRGYDRRPSADLAALTEQARSRVAAALVTAGTDLSDRHVEEYRAFFDRVDLDLSGCAPDAERYYHLGRYLLISSSRPGTQAANLQGIWNADVRPGWSSNYTTNINVEMNYWAAEQTALAQMHEPLFDLVSDLAAAGTATAQRYYASAGAVAHHNTDIWRFTAPVNGDPQWASWPSGLLWLATHLGEHLDYGGRLRDGDLLALRAAAAFALDMLVPDTDGVLVMSPSTSPENRFVADGGDAAVTEGSAMDQELVHAVLTRYTALADDDLAERARAALAVLRPVVIGPEGELLEWYDERPPREPGHRHLSHLYGLHPGTRITEAGTPAEFQAARRALRTRLDNGSGHTGWSQAWILCLAARLRDPDLAERSIAILLGELSSASLLDLHPHPAWPGGHLFQIDGNLGAVAGMTELLVQSHEQAISLLKTLPPSWHSGTVRGIRCRGGHQVSVTWAGGALTEVTIITGPHADVVIEVAAASTPVAVIDAEGRRLDTREVTGAVAGRRRIGWTGEPHSSYRLSAYREDFR
ncbi:glycoside hydrolase family 95 protein [Actinoplanes sp. NBRC 101535]|uniref:glycoside hydrolase family 95 protein n=1 Tax=Actinoplanes sp. NBRC 101535 TaxID=3032196 RepID=UPI0024A3EF7B|nr:glycoside hydrolase family 95 protein [Actinoplanes sp. NBRC 101535]GLY08513.1 hypothetical protein Acsp01_88920 [Actinoplanes sp. NBRC 101535]